MRRRSKARTKPRFVRRMIFLPRSGARCAEPRLARRGRLRGAIAAPISKPRFVRRMIFLPRSGARCAEPRLARRGRLRGAIAAPISKPRFVRRMIFLPCSGARCAQPRLARPSRSPGRDSCAGDQNPIKTPVRPGDDFFVVFGDEVHRTAARPRPSRSPGNPGSHGG